MHRCRDAGGMFREGCKVGKEWQGVARGWKEGGCRDGTGGCGVSGGMQVGQGAELTCAQTHLPASPNSTREFQGLQPPPPPPPPTIYTRQAPCYPHCLHTRAFFAPFPCTPPSLTIDTLLSMKHTQATPPLPPPPPGPCACARAARGIRGPRAPPPARRLRGLARVGGPPLGLHPASTGRGGAGSSGGAGGAGAAGGWHAPHNPVVLADVTPGG